MSKKKKAYQLLKKQRDMLYHFYAQTCIFFNVHLQVPKERKYPTLVTNMKHYIDLFNNLSKDILSKGILPDPETLNWIGLKWNSKIPEIEKELNKLVDGKKGDKKEINSMYG